MPSSDMEKLREFVADWADTHGGMTLLDWPDDDPLGLAPPPPDTPPAPPEDHEPMGIFQAGQAVMNDWATGLSVPAVRKLAAAMARHASAMPEFLAALNAAVEARDGSSNDAEIDALWDVVHHACGLLGVPEP